MQVRDKIRFTFRCWSLPDHSHGQMQCTEKLNFTGRRSDRHWFRQKIITVYNTVLTAF